MSPRLASPRLARSVLAASSALAVFGIIDCSSDSGPAPFCADTSSVSALHRSVTLGASKLDIELSSSSSDLRLVVDGLLALDVTTVSTPQGLAETATQGPAYAGQQQHVIHLLRSGDQVTGDVDGKALAPFSNDADASSVHFADGTPFTAGTAPSSAHIVETYRQLSEALTSGACLDTGSASAALSVPAQPESPQSGVRCEQCHATCQLAAVGMVTGGTATCAAIFDGAFFGIPFGVCVLGVITAAAVYDFAICIPGCDAVGGTCCPHTCDAAGDNEFCCDSDSTCSNADQHLCCPSSTTPCNLNCCDKTTETCTSITNSTCCPNSQACGHTCCAAGAQCVGGSACCEPDRVCGNQCCNGGETCQFNPDGQLACVCPASQQCGTQCCPKFLTNCAPADGACCPSNHPICGGHCCAQGLTPPCTTDSSGNEVCNTCPSGNTICSGICCTNGSPCLADPTGVSVCCPDSDKCGPSCCPNGCANSTTGQCNP